TPQDRGRNPIRIEVIASDASLIDPSAPQYPESWDAYWTATYNPSFSAIQTINAFVVDGAPVFGTPQIRTFRLEGGAFVTDDNWLPTAEAQIGGTGRATFRFTVRHEEGLSALHYQPTSHSFCAAGNLCAACSANPPRTCERHVWSFGSVTNLLPLNGAFNSAADFTVLNNPASTSGTGIAVRAVRLNSGDLGFVAGQHTYHVYAEVNANLLVGGVLSADAARFPLRIVAFDPSAPTPISAPLHATMPIVNIVPEARYDLNTLVAGLAPTLGGSARPGDEIGGIARVVVWFERHDDAQSTAQRRGVSWNGWGGAGASLTGNFRWEPTPLPGVYREGTVGTTYDPVYLPLHRPGEPGITYATGGNYAIVIDRSDPLGTQSHHGHRVPMTVATGVPGTLGSTWHFVIDSTRIPSGPTEMHFVVFDLAGNATHSMQRVNIMNDAPLIQTVQIATDLRGGGLQGHIGTSVDPGNIARPGGIMAAIRGYWGGMGIPADTTSVEADERRGISPLITPNTQVTGSPTLGALQRVDNFTIRNGLMALAVDTIQAPGDGLQRRFILDAVQNMTTVNAGLIEAGNVYIIAAMGTGIPWLRLGATNVAVGSAFMATTDGDDIDGLAAMGGQVHRLNTISALRLEQYFAEGAPALVASSAEFAYTTAAFGAGTGFIQDWDGSDNTLTGTGMFVLTVMDGPPGDLFADVTVLRLDVNNADRTAPFAQLYDLNPHAQLVAIPPEGRHPHAAAPEQVGPQNVGGGFNLGQPGLWRNLDTNMSRPGNIEPRLTTGLTDTQLTGGNIDNFNQMERSAFPAVDTVSGRVVLRGYAEDNQRIGSVDLVFTPVAPSTVAAQTVRILESITATDPSTGPVRTGLLQVPTAQAGNVFFADTIDLYRHRVEWAFVWDTALVPDELVVGDVNVRAIANPATGTAGQSEQRILAANGTIDTPTAFRGTDIRNHNIRNPGFPTALPMYNQIRVDIRPYLTGFRRNVNAGFNDTRFDSRGNLMRGTRSLQGRYALARGEVMAVAGFNLQAGAVLNFPVTGDAPGTTDPNATQITGFGITDREDRYQIFTVPTGAVSGNGIVTLTVDGFPAVNRAITHVQPWHMEDDPRLDGTALWNNRTAVHIWDATRGTGATEEDHGSFPRTRATGAPAGNWAPIGVAMSIHPGTGVLHASFAAAGQAFGAGADGTANTNNLGWVARATNSGDRGFERNEATTTGGTTVRDNAVLIGWVDPMINTSIFVNYQGVPWTSFSAIGRSGTSQTWNGLGGLMVSGLGGAARSIGSNPVANTNIYQVESAWFNASNETGAVQSTPPATDQFINSRVITFRGADDREHIHVSYFDTLTNSIKYRHNLRNTPGVINATNVPRRWTNLDGSYDQEDTSALTATAPFPAVAANGRVVAATTHTGGAVRRGSGSTTAITGSSPGVTMHNDIAVTSQGFPVVVYYDGDRLRIAVSNNVMPIAGSHWRRFYVGPGIGIGEYVSIRIDTRTGQNNRVHIAALDNNHNNLVYITGTITFDAGNVASWNSDPMETVDNVGNVGRRTRLSLDAQGTPWITYLDSGFVGGRDGVKLAYRLGDDNWEAMHVPAPFNVIDESHFELVSQLGLENFPTARTNHAGTLVAPTQTRIWSAAVGFMSPDYFRLAYLVR
ncbi:MAG: hypothetical protein FWD88_03730, partial [Treponema sp.]|nr:hypothetical protein [Treponema sp.]